jgi:hypothetical protein
VRRYEENPDLARVLLRRVRDGAKEALKTADVTTLETLMQKLAVIATTIFALALLAPAAQAQNLVPNATFDTDLSNWQVFGAEWDPEDSEGTAGSGSVRITNTSDEPDVSTIGLTVCVPANEGTTYQVGFDGLIPTGQVPTGEARMTVVWFEDAGCEFEEGIASFDIATTQTGVWQQMRNELEAPIRTQSALIHLGSYREGATGTHTVKIDNVFFSALESGCTATDTTLCLAGGRFAVEASWVTTQGTSGLGHAEPLSTDTGTFWFFDEANTELVVKVLDACPVNGHFWVFAGGLTNVFVELTVTDTESGESNTYTNPQETAFQPIQDTDAFDTCSF